jgi:hypothetical protein
MNEEEKCNNRGETHSKEDQLKKKNRKELILFSTLQKLLSHSVILGRGTIQRFSKEPEILAHSSNCSKKSDSCPDEVYPVLKWLESKA